LRAKKTDQASAMPEALSSLCHNIGGRARIWAPKPLFEILKNVIAGRAKARTQNLVVGVPVLIIQIPGLVLRTIHDVQLHIGE
jgi:hypothetical protein